MTLINLLNGALIAGCALTIVLFVKAIERTSLILTGHVLASLGLMACATAIQFTEMDRGYVGGWLIFYCVANSLFIGLSRMQIDSIPK